jgi:transcriptional regulator with XRE-family HTH domain
MPSPDSIDKNFDAEGFYAAIASTVVARGVTWKQVSQETGISTTTLTRMSQGRKPDAASLAALSAWAAVNPADFVQLAGSVSHRPEPLAQITTLLRSDRRLKPEAAQALEAMIRSAYSQMRKDR